MKTGVRLALTGLTASVVLAVLGCGSVGVTAADPLAVNSNAQVRSAHTKSITVTADTSDLVRPSATVDFVVGDSANRPPNSTVTVSSVKSGVAISGGGVALSAAVAGTNTQTASIIMTFFPPASLGAGSFTGTFIVTVCYDAPAHACTGTYSGGTYTANITLVVTGSPVPVTRVSYSPASFALQAGAKSTVGAAGTITLTLSKPAPPLFVSVARPAGGLVATSVLRQPLGASAANLSITLVSPLQLSLGTHVQQLRVDVCIDTQCQRPLQGSPLTIPLTYTIVPLAGLSDWYGGGFSGKSVVVWGNSTVSNALNFFSELRSFASSSGLLSNLDPNRILNFGNNGASLAAMLAGQGPFPITAVVAAQPDLLIIRGPLINDVRLGGTSLQQAEQLLATALDEIRRGSPRTAILLTTENSLLSADVGNNGWVKPNSAAQTYTNIMHDAVMSFSGKYPNVEVFDLMAAEYGQTVKAASLLMADQLHPGALGQTTEADLVAALIGLPPGTVN